eukprot:XP_017946240.1 PREDICTED: ephrin type-A receptor 8-like [Xenopus tropicalis]
MMPLSLGLFRQGQEMHSYSTLRAKETRAIVSGLKPGTHYVFQVRARTSAGCGRFSPTVEVETSKAMALRYNTRTIVWICLILITGLVILLSVLICKKRYRQVPSPIIQYLWVCLGRIPSTRYTASFIQSHPQRCSKYTG